MFDIITIGDATFDTFIVLEDGSPQCRLDATKNLLCINYADKVPIEKIDQSIGGNASNVAAGTKRLGLNAAIVTQLGDDLNGLAIQHQLQEEGVNMSLSRIEKNKQTRFSVVLNYKGERTILSYHAPRAYHIPKLPKTTWLYYTSLGKHFESVQKKVVTFLKKNPDTKLALNPGSYQMKSGIQSMRDLLPLVDVLFVNKQEAEALVEKKQSISNLLQNLHHKPSAIIVITDGMAGSYAFDGTYMYHMPPYPVVITGKTGAGDAYASGFLSAIYLKKPPREAMQWGTANASGVIQKVGAHQGLLTVREIKKMIQKFHSIQPTPLGTSTSKNVLTPTKKRGI
jgi:sugar/nucleoside kinase (ribokinase family)